MVQALEAALPDPALGVDDLLEVVEEPGVDMGQGVDPFDAVAALQRLVDVGDPLGVRHPQAMLEVFAVEMIERLPAVAAEAETAGLERAHALSGRPP